MLVEGVGGGVGGWGGGGWLRVGCVCVKCGGGRESWAYTGLEDI